MNTESKVVLYYALMFALISTFMGLQITICIKISRNNVEINAIKKDLNLKFDNLNKSVDMLKNSFKNAEKHIEELFETKTELIIKESIISLEEVKTINSLIDINIKNLMNSAIDINSNLINKLSEMISSNKENFGTLFFNLKTVLYRCL